MRYFVFLKEEDINAKHPDIEDKSADSPPQRKMLIEDWVNF